MQAPHPMEATPGQYADSMDGHAHRINRLQPVSVPFLRKDCLYDLGWFDTGKPLVEPLEFIGELVVIQPQ